MFLIAGACSSDSPTVGNGDQPTRGVITAGAPATATTGNTPPVISQPTQPIPMGAAGSAPITPPPGVTPGAAGVPARPPETRPPAAAGSGAPAMPTMPTTPPPPAGPPIGTGMTCLKPGNGQYTNPGPYKVSQMEIDLGMIDPMQHTGKFTIYYPDPLEASCPHPIVAWGNGTGVMGSGTYAFLNSNAASWGIVVAESQEDNTGSGKFHKAGIDWLLKQNDDPMSKFYKKLTTRAGVSGHSQGGFGAAQGSAHPNVTTAVVEGASMNASAKVSVLVLTGTEDIVKNAETLANNARGPMFVGNWEGGDHVTTETVAGALTGDKGSAQFSRLYAAWFRCFLGDDPVACKMFMGGAPGMCGICKDPGWHSLTSKNL
ncbi:MAG TPA: hypothetical protein VJV78_02850 [Polyangiales bacterium]|nr:hypothetical protein [Polyangiales bacterium]